MMIKNVLVVCIGNICRSPLAEAQLRHLAGDKVHVSSAGLGAVVGHSAHELSRQIATEQGLDIDQHIARQINSDLLHQAELVLVMEDSHVRAVESISPLMRGRVFRLGKWQDMEIPDPNGLPRDAFDEAWQQIESCCKDWHEKLWK